MENIDKIKCVLIDFENNDKTLDETAKEILLLFSVVGRSEQLKCDCCSYEYSKLTLKANGRKLCKDCA